MLDIEFIRNNLDFIRKNNVDRGVTVDIVNKFIECDHKIRANKLDIELLRAERNELSTGQPTEEKKERVRRLKERIGPINQELFDLEVEWKMLLSQFPNISDKSVPIGESEAQNQIVKAWGKKPLFDFTPRAHEELGAINGTIDSERGARVSGSRFYYLKGDLVLLERALMEYAFRKAVGKGYIPLLPPILVKERAMWNTGWFPAEKNEIYAVNQGEKEDNLFLVGTSEVPVVSMHQEDTFEEKNLPLRYTAFTPCFRREAGSYGRDQHGILRVHQFNKVELVVFCAPEASWDIHEEIRALEEELLQELGIPYQVVNCCTGDLGGGSSAKRYDIEGWFPAQGKYRELTSASNTTDFQTRRGNIKMKRGKKKIFPHCLNGTMVADRALLALLENNQTRDGGVVVPKALRPYFGKDELPPTNIG